MKRLYRALLLIMIFSATFIINTEDVSAASFSVSTSSSTVSAGGQATITIKASDCGGQFSISASGGAKVSSSSLWVESGSSSVTVTAPASGSFSVTVTATDVANSAGTDVVTGSKSVSMSVPAPTTSSTNTTTNSSSSSSSNSTSTQTAVVVETKSKENNLANLSVDKGELSPEFSASTTSYSVSLQDETEITLSATVKDSKAKMSGTGEKELKSGENSFSITVTAEDGSTKTYTINVNVKYSPTVFVTVGDMELGFVEVPEVAKIPSDFEKTLTKIGEDEVQSWVDSNSGIQIVCLVDEDDNEILYVLEDGEITSTFSTMTILGKSIYILDIAEDEQERTGLVFQLVEVDGNELMGWGFEREELSEFALLRVVLKNGDVEEYLYSSVSNTMIHMDYEVFLNTAMIDEAIADNEELIQTNNKLTNSNGDLSGNLTNMKIILAIVSVISVIGLSVSIFIGRGYKKDYLSMREEYGIDEEFMDTEDIDLPNSDEVISEMIENEVPNESIQNEVANESIENEIVVEDMSELNNHKLDLSEFEVDLEDTEA